jgi:polygalacturonase
MISVGSIPVFAGNREEAARGWNLVPQILKRIVPPKFPDRNFLITDYGAVAGGKALCTEAFVKAIDACSKAGGGHVVVPEGVFLTGAIHLKSNIDLHISEGAVVKFSTNPNDYLPLVHARWQGITLMNYSPLIYAYGQENVALTGRGLLDGQADSQHWWPWKKLSNKPISWPLLEKYNDEKAPLNDRVFGPGHYLRPTFVEFYRCRNVLIKDVHLENSPFWFLHPVLCTNVTIDGVETNASGPNTDGCDPESCTDVLVQHCVFNTGDDCIAIKSGRNNDGRRVNVPAKDMIIRDCTMRNGHGGVSIGSEITGGAEDIFIENCNMSSPDLDQALRLKSNKKRGGIIQNIYARNIKVGQVKVSILRVNLNYDPPEAKGYSYYPIVRNVFVDNLTSQKSEYGLFLTGLPQSKIQHIVLKDCELGGVAKGNNIQFTTGLRLENVWINGELSK